MAAARVAADKQALPAALWGLDPLFSAHVKLFAATLHSLRPFDGVPGEERARQRLAPKPRKGSRARRAEVRRLHDRPIQRVELLGWVVGASSRKGLECFTIDDGTGLVCCVRWPRGGAAAAAAGRGEAPALGELVRVRGSLSFFREQLEVKVVAVQPVRDWNSEALFWLEAVQLDREVYRRPSPVHRLLSDPRAAAAETRSGVYSACWAHLSQLERPFTLADVDAFVARLSKGDAAAASAPDPQAATASAPAALPVEFDSSETFVQRLRASGLVTEARQGEFEVLSPARHVEPLLLDFFSRTAPDEAVHVSTIEQQLRLRMPGLASSLVRAALDALVAKKVLLRVGPESFCCAGG